MQALRIKKMNETDQNAVVCVTGCCKSFNGVTVFDNVCFDLMPGEIHCLCGENGAGKSTFIKIVSGAYYSDKGTVEICGVKIKHFEPDIVRKLGVQTIYQSQFLMPDLSVAENIFMGDYVTKAGFIDYKGLAQKAKVLLDELELDIDPNILVSMLDVADRQTVQIARALAQDAKILIFDEPTASFGRKEKMNLLKIIKRIASRGIGIIYISHHLDEVFELADRVTVLRDGRKISCYTKDEIDEKQIIRDMVGRDTDLYYKREHFDLTDPGVLSVRGLGKNGYIKPCSFDVRRGEIVGFGGMVGSGRTELMNLLFGAKKADTGDMSIDNVSILPKDPHDAIRKGICLITEDRQATGLFTGHSVGWNFVSAAINKRKGVLLHQKSENRQLSQYIKNINIKTEGCDQDVCYLSGGNQQKVVLSKWMYAKAEIIIFDEPTKGIDIGAKEDVYVLITQLAKEGKFVIVVSSDMPELIAISDRVIVMKNREIVAELTGSDINEETILSYSIGG